ncbi:MAG: HypC/HybG/HupF family hydrogenase formation chaperone [Synechocystis sp.]|jgi:hydrogenase expression/formation protein HypC
MCLAMPGKVVSLIPNPDPLLLAGKVSFGGIVKTVSLAYVPEVQPGDYVIVHVGFAISIVDEVEAQNTLTDLAELENLQQLSA